MPAIPVRTGASGGASLAGALERFGQPGAAAWLEAPEKQAILCERYRKLVRHYLRRLPALFTRFTGLFSHVIWAPAWPGRLSVRKLPTNSRICRQLVAARPNVAVRCRECAAAHLAAALRTGHSGHRFTCFLGVHNFWLPVTVRKCIVGLAFVQALALPGAGASSRQKPVPPMRRTVCRSAMGGPRQTSNQVRGMSDVDFCEAADLLGLVIEHGETSAVADLRKSDLMQAQRALTELQTVATRLRGELNGLVPSFNRNAPKLELERHADRVVRAMLEYIHQHYSEPITLGACSQRLGLSTAYLSSLFSRQVGVPFKTYMTQVQIERARELLSDPTRNVGEIAFAVGYRSENRFRIAFKNATGLSPRLWRETLRIETPLAG